MISGDHMESLKLINEVNSYLDELSNYKKVISNMDEIIDMVKKYKEEMSSFVNPFGNIKINLDGLSANELSEVRKQIKMIKYIAYLKKITLLRAKLSFSSLAVGQRLINVMKVPEESDYLSFIPYNGNLLGYISRYGVISSILYSRMKVLLSLTHLPEQHKIKIRYKDEKNDEKQEILILTNINGLNKKIKEKYGEDSEILSIDPLKKPIIHSGHVRSVVSCYYSLKACEERFESLRRKHITNKIKMYKKIVSGDGFDEWTSLNIIREHPKLMDKLIAGGFVDKRISQSIDEKEYASENIEYVYNQEFEPEILIYRRRIIDSLSSYAKKDFLNHLYIYYMTTSKTYREKNNLFPTLATEPNETQLSVFDGISWTNKDVLSEKFRIEKLVKEDHKYIGPALYKIRLNEDVEKVAERFNVDPEGLKRNIKIISSLITGRGKEFLEKVNFRKGRFAMDNECKF